MPQANKDRLTKKQKSFIKLYQDSQGDVYKVANTGKFTVNACYHMLDDPRVKNRLANTLNVVREKMVQSSPAIFEGLMKMFGDEGTPANVRANIGLQLMDRAGLATPKEPAMVVNINTSISERARQLVAKRVEQDIEEAEIIQDKLV